MAADTDVVVVGGGIIGLATARALLHARPGLGVTVLEKEPAVGVHQTGHSSNVLHSGVYYAPGSLKATLCVAGARQLRDFCADQGIPVLDCGKLIVAIGESELARLDELHRRATANGVPGLELLDGDGIRALEPHTAGICALRVPGTAVVDYRLVAERLAAEIARLGGSVRTATEVTGIARTGDGVALETPGGVVAARHVVACAGLHADRVARLTGGDPEPRIVPFRGDYYVLRPHARSLVNGLVYPVPDPQFPFLGVHSTLRPDGSLWLGPNALLAVGRETYGRWPVVPRDLLDAAAAPGFRRLVRRHWRTGAVEAAQGYSKRLFVRAAQRLFPEIGADDVERGPSGIRAQALSADGALVEDFVFESDDRVLHVRNAPSPGATSALAIADEIVARAVAGFSL